MGRTVTVIVSEPDVGRFRGIADVTKLSLNVKMLDDPSLSISPFKLIQMDVVPCHWHGTGLQ